MLYKDEYDKWNYYKRMIKNNIKYLMFHSKKNFIKKIYHDNTNKEINIDQPQTFTEKLQYRKLTKNKLFEICADKMKVRDYVKNKIGEKYLIPEYFCKKKITYKDLQNLPNEFILKTSNGSGTNKLVLDKSKENLHKLAALMNYYTTIKYGYIWGEFYYNKSSVSIVAEKLLKDEKGQIPNDYKIHCFDDGKTKRKVIEVHYKVNGENKKNIYDENWEPIKDYIFGFSSDGRKIPRPENIKELLYVADKLSEDTNYVRVDLYNIKNKIYFGELTFIPGAGYAHFEPETADLLWGNYMGEEKKWKN